MSGLNMEVYWLPFGGEFCVDNNGVEPIFGSESSLIECKLAELRTFPWSSWKYYHFKFLVQKQMISFMKMEHTAIRNGLLQ